MGSKSVLSQYGRILVCTGALFCLSGSLTGEGYAASPLQWAAQGLQVLRGDKEAETPLKPSSGETETSQTLAGGTQEGVDQPGKTAGEKNFPAEQLAQGEQPASGEKSVQGERSEGLRTRQPLTPSTPSVIPVQPPAPVLIPQQNPVGVPLQQAPGVLPEVNIPVVTSPVAPVVPQPVTPVVIPPVAPVVPPVEPTLQQPVPAPVVKDPVLTPVVKDPVLVPSSEPVQTPSALVPTPQPILTPGAFLLKADPQVSKPGPVAEKPEKKSEKKSEKKPVQATEKPVEKTKPEKPAAPVKTAATKPGEGLNIPEEAKKTGNLDFLKGCWIGQRPEYNSKRIVTERFCFGENGVGKRFIEDPGEAGKCVGATKALLNKNGILRMQSESMHCSSGSKWGASIMTCQGEGEETPCDWVFTNAGGAKQSYKIRFVRE